jgi:hypothetical protein
LFLTFPPIILDFPPRTNEYLIAFPSVSIDALVVTGVVCRATAGAEKVVFGRGRGLPSATTGPIGLDTESSIDIVAMESFVSSNAPDDEAIVETV